LRLWVDDERPAPDDTWTWVKTAAAAYEAWSANDVTELSLDHDLGEGGDTRELATSILGMAHGGQRPPPRWFVHSANPVGFEYLTDVLERADKFWRRHMTQLNLASSYAKQK
jgi:hypothetical protein